MATLTIPDLDDAVSAWLEARARYNGRTVEAEACAILEEALPVPSIRAEDRGLAQDG